MNCGEEEEEEGKEEKEEESGKVQCPGVRGTISCIAVCNSDLLKLSPAAPAWPRVTLQKEDND